MEENGLRHSFISYRVGKTDNENKVALEAGNSAAVIRSNYLKMVTKAKARQWFSIKPADGTSIIQLANHQHGLAHTSHQSAAR